MRVFALLLLSFGLFTACGTQPTATQAPTRGNASVRAADTVRLPKEASAQRASPVAPESTIPPPPPDSIMSFVAVVGARTMKFNSVSDADLHAILFNNGLSDELLSGRFRLINERYKQLRLYYQLTPRTGDWIETQLEPMDNAFTDACEIKLVSGVLGNQSSPVVLVTMEWKATDRGGESTCRVVNLIDVTREPRLLLKMETLAGRVPYNHDDEDQQVETSCEQAVTLRNGEIVIGAPSGDCDGTNFLLAPVSGRYRYENGKLFRVGK